MTAHVKIERLSNDGRGIAYVDGKVVFVAGALPDEQVSIKVLRQHKRFDEAEVVKRFESPHGEPPCNHFETCGGCDWMRLDPATALATKADLVKQAFERLLKEELGERWLEPVASAPLGYRCRVKLKLADGAVGYYTAGTHRFAPIDTCLVANEAIRKAIPSLSADAGRFLTAGYREVELRAAPGDSLPIAVFTGKGRLPQVPPYLRGIASAAGSIGDASLAYVAGGARFTVSPGSFVQVNLAINEILIGDVLAAAGPGDDDIIDAFCGIGNFSVPLALTGRRVLGMEGAASSIADAETNSRRNNVAANTQWYCVPEPRMAEQWLKAGFSSEGVLVLDPPRAGARELLAALPAAKLRPRRIVYVSCDPGTLLRDAAELLKSGYGLTSVKTYDMFPQTHHVETLAVFTRTP